MLSPIALAFYNEMKGWQTAIGSLLGFVALMVGALWNFHLNRRRDTMLQKEEALSVAAALYGEILLLRRELARLARAVANTKVKSNRDIDAYFVEAFQLSEPLLYKALAPKLGLLNAELIVAITAFYKNFQEARNWLPLLEREGRGFSYSVATVLEPARSAIQDIVPTLRNIETMALISKPAEHLDLGYTDAVIEVEETAFSQP